MVGNHWFKTFNPRKAKKSTHPWIMFCQLLGEGTYSKHVDIWFGWGFLSDWNISGQTFAFWKANHQTWCQNVYCFFPGNIFLASGFDLLGVSNCSQAPAAPFSFPRECSLNINVSALQLSSRLSPFEFFLWSFSNWIKSIEGEQKVTFPSRLKDGILLADSLSQKKIGAYLCKTSVAQGFLSNVFIAFVTNCTEPSWKSRGLFSVFSKVQNKPHKCMK